jgi:hypothetical protein
MLADLTIYVDRKSGDWTIERSAICKRTRFTVSTGSVIRIKAADIDIHAAKEVMSAIEGFGEEEDPELSDIDAMPLTKRNKFLRNQTKIGVSEQEDSSLVFQMMERSGKGWIGSSRTRMTCKRETALKEIVSVVRRVLAQE